MDQGHALDVFVSYKREDRARVTPLVECLRAAGLHVWWDTDVPGGAPWREQILQQLDAARCVIIVWSEASVSPAGEFVHEEADRAKRRGVLLPVHIDAVSPPLGFGQIQSLDLAGWNGDTSDVRARNVVAAARAQIAGGARPAPVVPIRRRWRVAGAAAIVVSSVSFIADLGSIQSLACSIPGVYSVCGAFGVGGVPTREERDEWAKRPAGDCAWLRAFRTKHPGEAYAAEIDRLLQSRREVVDEIWRADSRTEPIHVPASLAPLPTLDAARGDALVRGSDAAALACRGFTTGAYQLRAARVAAESVKWTCTPASSGVRCSFDADAVCDVDARQSTPREVCD